MTRVTEWIEPEWSEYWYCTDCRYVSYWPKEDGKISNGCYDCANSKAVFQRMTVPRVLEMLNNPGAAAAERSK
jgi:hypothetical protein